MKTTNKIRLESIKNMIGLSKKKKEKFYKTILNHMYKETGFASLLSCFTKIWKFCKKAILLD